MTDLSNNSSVGSCRGALLKATCLATMLLSSVALVQAPAIAAPQTSVAGFGLNALGQLGHGTTADSSTAALIPDLSNVDEVSAGGLHTLITHDDGHVSAAGYNALGTLGDGTQVDSDTPVDVDGLADVDQVSAGFLHSLAVDANGDVWAWGYNALGTLGNGDTTDHNVPVKVSGLTDVTAVSTGLLHSLALKEDGTVWSWGFNVLGTLGDGTTVDRLVPTQVSGLTGVRQISAGALHNLALNDAGTVFAWGYNGMGQLGNGTTTDSITPVRVLALGGPADMVSAGGFHSLARRTSGSVRAWGYNAYGQIGNGTTLNRSLPVTVSNLTAPDMLSAGYLHNLALKDGRATAWGWNGYGQLGDATTTDRTKPVAVKNLTDVSSVSAGLLHSIAAGKFDTAEPVLSLPNNITNEATASTGATVDYAATATDAVDGAVDIDCQPASESLFGVGDTVVNCSAADAQGNSGTGSFTVSVVDTTEPELTVPDDITMQGSVLGEVVEFTATATDIVDGTIIPVCTPPSGSTFPVGTTTVNCAAVDDAGNTAQDSFTVTVTLL
jgi:alpha-tubulin suppressor-like RCC1 family protein